MGIFDSYDLGSSSSKGILDLKKFEEQFLDNLNDSSTLSIKWRAEAAGYGFDKRTKSADIYEYSGEKIIICPEPLNFIKEYDDVSDDKTKANEKFREAIQKFQVMELNQKPLLSGEDSIERRMWTNKTLTGINLRPGNKNDDQGDFTAIKMCDDNVHGLIAGRTGSGKSVYINALILSLITEYPPWELDLYLADFKKVELSRYMNDADRHNEFTSFTPHVKACAATSEVRYVISLIKHLVDCMNARNEFFTRLGVTKIQEFRNAYDVVLPRVLLIVDEFQQLFSEATSGEAEEIQTMLNSITKLGRATGFHLIFASQEMSGTLRGNTLANFKIRMTLPCNPQISVDVLGNDAAASLERGYVLVNTESGDREANLKYRVPFIETEKKDADDSDEKTAFYRYLDEVKIASMQYAMEYKRDSQKFYREELQEMERGENVRGEKEGYLYDLDRIKDAKNSRVKENRDLFDGIVLGKTVLYSERKNDKISFYIERGRNKGIMIASPNTEDVAKIRKLLTENLVRSDDVIQHIGLELNNLVYEKYPINEKIKNAEKQSYVRLDLKEWMQILQLIYYLRRQSMQYLNKRCNQTELGQFREFIESLLRLKENAEEEKAYERYAARCSELVSQIKELQQQKNEAMKKDKSVLDVPILEYLEKCDIAIGKYFFPAGNEPMGFDKLKAYAAISAEYKNHFDLQKASESVLRILDKDEKEFKEKNDDDSMTVRSRIACLKAVILYYSDRFYGKNTEEKKFTPIYREQYEKVLEKTAQYKKEIQEKQEALSEIEQITQQLEAAEKEYEQLKQAGNAIDNVQQDILSCMKKYIDHCYQQAYIEMGYKKDAPAVPVVSFTMAGKDIVYEVTSGDDNQNEQFGDEIIEVVTKNVLDVMYQYSKTHSVSAADYSKYVFWLNGLDEIEKEPKQLVEIIRDAINYNMLMVVSITSELKDSTIRKAFDYAFVTGNIVKFYEMFDIKYTKQPLDSIVVNFGIRSKGLSMPFKMYKSRLSEKKPPQFIEDLLEGV